jgi:hypothetical protein
MSGRAATLAHDGGSGGGGELDNLEDKTIQSARITQSEKVTAISILEARAVSAVLLMFSTVVSPDNAHCDW